MYLDGVKDILPDIEGSVGVSEGQNDELLIDAHDALDIHLGLLDVMCVDWTIAVVAHLAVPEGELVIPTDDEGVGECHLVVVREGIGQSQEEGEQKQLHSK